jgi:hypothetical protein
MKVGLVIVLYAYHTIYTLPFFTTNVTHPRLQKGMRLERIVLWCYLLLEPGANDGDLLSDVVAHARDLGEHEEHEDAGCGAEVAGCGCPVKPFVSMI